MTLYDLIHKFTSSYQKQIIVNEIVDQFGFNNKDKNKNDKLREEYLKMYEELLDTNKSEIEENSNKDEMLTVILFPPFNEGDIYLNGQSITRISDIETISTNFKKKIDNYLIGIDNIMDNIVSTDDLNNIYSDISKVYITGKSIEFIAWKDILGQNVCIENAELIGVYKYIAGILYDMTMFGLEETTIANTKVELDMAISSVFPEDYMTADEFFKSLELEDNRSSEERDEDIFDMMKSDLEDYLYEYQFWYNLLKLLNKIN